MKNNNLPKAINSRFARVLFVIALVFILLNMLFPLTVNIPYSSKIMSREGELLQAFLSEDDKWRMKCEPGSYPDNLKNAFLYKEDRWFYYHPGINPFAVARALFNNTVKGYRTSGASTITMQVARLLKPGKRTVLNKIHEAFIALQLELHYSKDEILSLYFELIPYGGNIEGIHAASYIYFGKEAHLLSVSESTLLAIIPNKPTSLKPGRNDQLLAQQRNKWLRKFHEAGLLGNLQLEDALNEPVVIKRQALPVVSPHFTTMVKRDNSGLPVIKTTLSMSIQQAVQQITYNHHLRLRLRHIYNTSVLVVDNKSREVLAFIGNADFNDSEHAGQVNGVHAIRSPGSTLKPLVYGLAMDKGLITPKTVLPDVPVNYNGYSPENFSRDYQGEITAEDALAQSLNLPAVGLLQQIGMDSFLSALKQCSFNSISRSEESLGLSAVLGGCGVSLEELTGLYSAFANKGEYRSLKYLLGHDQDARKKILSAEAAYMITQTLTKAQRPDLPNQFESNYNIPSVAWKTGTSYGRRDAWSIGYNDKYTVAVWCGNFDGTGIPELTGADIATPLLFDLFSAIDRSGKRHWNRVPENIDIRYVCTSTGLAPGEYCTEKIMDQFIPNVSSTVRCMHMQRIAVNPAGTVSYCTNCREDDAVDKLYAVLKPQVCSYYLLKGIPFERIPEHSAACSRIYNDEPIEITSPLNNKEYLLEKGMDEKIALSCTPHPDASWLYWYLNDRLYKKSKVHETVFFQPDEGTTVVSCADDKGRVNKVVMQAKYF